MSTNGTYLDRVIDSVMLPYQNNYDCMIASEIHSIASGKSIDVVRPNCAIINVSDFAELNPSDFVSMRNGSNVLDVSAAEYNRFVVHQNQVFRDRVSLSYRSGDANASALFELVILQIVPKKSL